MLSTTRRTLTRTPVRALAVTAVLASAATLAGCGEDDSDTAPSAATSTAAGEAGSGGSDGSGGSGGSGGSTTTDTGALVKAGKLVIGKVSGSTLTSIEVDNGGWEVQVADADGVESEASVNAEGTSITRGPTKQDDDARDRSEHQARVRDAKLDFAQAADAIGKVAPGPITELGLDDHRGTTVWEADVREQGKPKVSVRIDAATGKVVTQTTEQPGDDD